MVFRLPKNPSKIKTLKVFLYLWWKGGGGALKYPSAITSRTNANENELFFLLYPLTNPIPNS